MLSGIIGLPREAAEGRRSREGNIRFPLPELDVTTLIIDLGEQQLRSFCIFLEHGRLIYFFNQGDRCQLSREKDTESCLKLSDGDILNRLRCGASICVDLPEAKGGGEGPKYCGCQIVITV